MRDKLLNLTGLNEVAKQIQDYIRLKLEFYATKQWVQKQIPKPIQPIEYTAGDNITINNNVISAQIPEGSHLVNTVIPIDWYKLKDLRDNGILKAGQQYRITDYVATTVQDETISANHPFDIIVTADNESTLNENARAILHKGDEYFANCDLAAWELKYCLDNDTNRFAWADDGKVKSFCVRSTYDDEYIEGGGKFIPIGLLSDVIADIHYGQRITQEFPEGKYIWASENDYYYSYAITESEYFSQGSRVFYCESNGDSSSFGYVDNVEKGAQGGKGVVYYMKDEWNNECPYDFKGIKKNTFLESVLICYQDGDYLVAKRAKELDNQNNTEIYSGEIAWVYKYESIRLDDNYYDPLPIEQQNIDWENGFDEVFYSKTEDLKADEYIKVIDYEPIYIKQVGQVLIPTEDSLYTFSDDSLNDASLYGSSTNNKIAPEFNGEIQVINRLKGLPYNVCNYQNTIVLRDGLGKNEDGSIYVKKASKDEFGGIIVGDNLNDVDGVVSADVSIAQIEDLGMGVISSKFYSANEYPTFEAIDNCTIKAEKTNGRYHSASVALEYSIEGQPWVQVDLTLTYYSPTATICTIPRGQSVRIRSIQGRSGLRDAKFILTGKVFLYGNLMFFYREDNLYNALYGYFSDCANLLSHPTKRMVIAAKYIDHFRGIDLSKTFYGCTNMRTSPIIIADSLLDVNCLSSTFENCSSLSRIDFFVKNINVGIPANFIKGLPTVGEFFTYSNSGLEQSESEDNTGGYIPFNWSVIDSDYIPANDSYVSLPKKKNCLSIYPNEYYEIYAEEDIIITKLEGSSQVLNLYSILISVLADDIQITFDGFNLSWYGGTPEWKSGHRYEISILNDVAVWMEI